MPSSSNDNEPLSDSMPDSSDNDDDDFRAKDDVVSNVDMRTSFVMSSDVLSKNFRHKKLLKNIPRHNNAANKMLTAESGLLVLHSEHDKLHAYGNFPWLP